jgi:membrane protein DedA with SNARE-associated domain
MEEIIKNYGYWAVFFGSCIEGESIILTAGFLASKGYMSLNKIILLSFLGTLLADQGLYWVGRQYGMDFLDKRPHWHKRIEKAVYLLNKYDTAYILSFRFIYGIRIISPLIIGACGIPVRRFTILNLIAAILWSIIISMVGYFFGEVSENVLTYIEENLAFLVKLTLLCVGGFLSFYFYYVKKRGAKEKS